MAITDLGKEPIPGPSPAGGSVRYDDSFAELAQEIAKLDSIHADAPAVDWDRVARLAELILAQKSKDLQVATYLCLGLFRTRGYPGLADGLGVVADMLDAFWESMFPELGRLRGRVNALGWLGERGGAAVAARRPGSGDKEPLDAARAALARLAALAGQRFGTDGPSLADLDRSLRTHAEAIAAEERKAQLAAEKAAEAAAAAATAQSGSFATVTEAHDVLLRIGTFLWEQDKRDALAYRLPRVVRWGALAQLPPAGAEGKTAIPAPPTQSRDPLLLLSEAGNWAVLLDQAEARFDEAMLWLDLQRLVDSALGGLGAEYAAARAAVRQETATLLARLPRLRELRYADGTPFADPATQTWLDGEVLKAAGGGGGSVGVSLEFLDQARELFGQGEVNEAFTVVQRELAGVPARERFICRLELAKLCLGASKPRLALRLLEALDQEIQRFGLEEWEPRLAAEVVKLLYQCRRAETVGRQATPEAMRSANDLYARLCRLDLLSALALDGA